MNDFLLPLLPSPTFRNAERCREIVQTIYASPVLISGVVFYASQKIAQNVVSSSSRFQSVFLPTAFIQRVAGDEDVVFRRISWIAPLSGIAISTFVSYTFYALLTSSLINGAILGCHSTAMQLFSQASWRDDALGLITLEGAIKSLVWSPDRFSHLSQTRLLMIEFKSDRLASVALFASSIVLTILFKNPILANGIAYPLAAITKIATMFFIDVLKIR